MKYRILKKFISYTLLEFKSRLPVNMIDWPHVFILSTFKVPPKDIKGI